MPENMLSEIRVLLIEDDALDSEWVRRLLAAYPGVRFHLAVVSMLEQALRHLDSSFFDAVLLDLNLPDSHGGETILRTLLHSTSVPLIVLSGNQSRHLSDSARQKGVCAYLVKGTPAASSLPQILHEAVFERRRIQAEEADRRSPGL